MALPPEISDKDDGLWPDDAGHIERWFANLMSGAEAIEYEYRLAVNRRAHDEYEPLWR